VVVRPNITREKMAKSREIPGFDRKRKVLFGEKSSPEQLRQMGIRFMEEERYYDALEFFERAGSSDLARDIATGAMDDGNAQLYMRAKKVLGEEIGRGEWVELAGKAERAGFLSAAHLAQVRAGNDEEAARLASLLPGLNDVNESPPDEEVSSASGADGEAD
jgi:hypothetical protein